MKKLLLLSSIALCGIGSNLEASEKVVFRATGKLIEAASSHTDQHWHQLKLLRLSDGETFDIVDSPELEKIHCKTDKNPVVEVEGYQTDKFLLWGGNLVVTAFQIHDDIRVATRPHGREQRIGTRVLRNPRP